MGPDKTQISGKQFMLIIACFLQSSSLLTSYLTVVTKNDTWMIGIFAFVLCIPLYLLYKTLIDMFPGKNFLQMLEETFGKVIGKIIGVLYLVFFLMLAALNTFDTMTFTNLTLLPNTPVCIIAISLLLVASFAVRKGIKSVSRGSFAFVVFSFFVLIFSIFLILPQMQISNFLPIFNQKPINYVQATNILIAIPYGEIIALLMLAPNIKQENKNMFKYFFGGLVMGAIHLLLIKVRDVGLLGSMYDMFSIPSLVVFRTVNVGEALSRIEILFSVVLIFVLYFKITLLYYISLMSVVQLFNLKSYSNLVLIVGAFILFLALTITPSPIKQAAHARETAPFAWAIPEIVIPLILFAVAKIKNFFKSKQKQQEVPAK